jgi:hypothetical protein
MKTWLFVMLMLLAIILEITRIQLGIPEFTMVIRAVNKFTFVMVILNYAIVSFGAIAEHRRK